MEPSSSRIGKYRGTMRLRQEGIDFAPLPVECQRVCACFGWHHLRAAHRDNIDDIYDPRIGDGHIEVSGLRMQKITSGAPLRGTSPSTRPDAASIANNAPASQAHNKRPLAGSRSSPCGPAAGTSYSVATLIGSRASITRIRAGDAILTKNTSRAAS